MNLTYNLRLALFFTVLFSLAVIAGPISSNLRLPAVALAHGVPEPCETHGSNGACSQFWYPAGPALDTLTNTIFTDSTAEYSDLLSATPHIDFPDAPIPPPIPCDVCLNGFVTTAPVGQTGYYEIQFMLANNFWGCNFNFGNSTCGVQIRQGIAHMIDKTSFTKNEPSIAGLATPIDNPAPTTSTQYDPPFTMTPNPCGYDTSFPQSGSQCVVSGAGGTAYHLANATGANGILWLEAPGSKDLDAAAAHFVAAGIAAGCDGGTGVASCIASGDSRLSGINSAAAIRTVSFFIRNDDTPRLHLGDSLAEQICYLFTGSYTTSCPQYLVTVHGPITAFAGFATSKTTTNQSWGMYTAFYNSIAHVDDSLYFTYNSRFVSGVPFIQPPNGPCSGQAVPTNGARNYMYLCNPAYDNFSSQMEFAPCTTAQGDPSPGQPINTGPGMCPGTTQPSAFTAGIQAEVNFGTNSYTIPIFEKTIQFAYHSAGWVRAINDNDVGLPNFFTWLNAWNAAPPVPDTIRQGFSQTTNSVNPYIASTQWDLYMIHNVYDSLYRLNPLNPSQFIEWMTISSPQLSNNALTYPPPPGTTSTFRFTLRSDMFFQDGRQVTTFDVAFSYLSMLASGAFLGTAAAPVTGVTILGPHQIDISVRSLGPNTRLSLTSLPILPGAYWTNAGPSAWNAAVSSCTATGAACYLAQYTLSGPTGPVACTFTCTFPPNLMNVNPVDTSSYFDPIANHSFVGSGPWACESSTGMLGSGCSSTGMNNPPVGGSYILTRFGKGLAPSSNVSGIYFRSNGNLALWTWTGNDGIITNDFLNFSVVASCFGNILGNPPCLHWEEGIGGCGAPPPCAIGLGQVAEVSRFVGVNWVTPFDWRQSPPTGIGQFAPILYEATITLNPASVAGCSVPYPAGGYDC